MESNYELFNREHRTGWNKLVDELISNLNNINQKWVITQCKEKFGGLRFYTSGCNDEQHKLISEAEKKSYSVCEVCGKKGILRDKIPYIQTLCWKHYAEELEKKLMWINKLLEDN